MEINSEFVKVVGTPTMMMLPARHYAFKVFKEDFVITIPRRGSYKDLDPKFFKDTDGEFEVLKYVEEERGDVLYIPSLSKILFATAQYPDLANDQAFVPVVFIVKEDVVEIVGNIIQMIKEEKES